MLGSLHDLGAGRQCALTPDANISLTHHPQCLHGPAIDKGGASLDVSAPKPYGAGAVLINAVD